jgi:DNA polymerase delta subunit 1
LDNVAQEFLFGTVSKVTIAGEDDPTIVWIHTKDTFGANVGGYIHVCDEEGDDIGGKLSVIHIGSSPPTMFPPEQKMKMIVVTTKDAEDSAEIIAKATRWTQAKDDVPPSEIFRLQKGSDDDRAVIAKYCVQDCDLVLDLLTKLDIVSNAMAMGSVCSVPFPYIFFRGQGIKLSSLLFHECQKVGLIVPVMPAPTFEESNDSYEGAVVLEPKTGLYLEQPVAVLDYNSLYPSSIISENISHDTIVAIWDRNNDGKVVTTKGDIRIAESLPTERFVDVTFDRYEPDPEDKRKNPEKIKVGTRTCRYYQFEDRSKKGIIGTILKELLAKRKQTKKRMDKETDPFKKALLNSLQLAYKVTANSLYGELGSKTSKIRFQDLAASTTSVGRSLIMYAKEGLERAFGRSARSDCNAAYVYGDTDSVFIAFNPIGDDGKPLHGRDAVEASIKLGKEAGKMLSSALREPHNLEYEKTFYPFALFSKKRYIGMKYEDDPDHCKQNNMGVVLKRRDNAPIVKEIYQAVIDMIMKERDLARSVDVARDIMRRLVSGEYSLKKLTITKSLRAHYANPEQIAHKVLAERIGVRDPGNKPKSNDRIAFVYFDSTKTRDGAKQGDRIETPEYMVEHKLQPDYKHYITNQIQKPLTQLFQLFWTQVPESKVTDKMIRNYRVECRTNPLFTKDKIEAKIDRMLEDDIERVIFNDIIRESVRIRRGPMDSFLGKAAASSKNARISKA